MGLVAEAWMIDELAHAGPEHLDPAFVAGYDRKQGHPDPAEDLDAFAAHGLDASSAIVDLGAGAGEIFRDWFDNAAADPAAGYTSEDYAEHIRTEFSTFRWLLEPMLAAAGFEILTVDFERHLYGAYTCIKRSA
jgi:hypothetical protein